MNDFIIVENGLIAIGGGAFFTEIRLVLVAAFVVVAAIFDVRTHRIPNWLVLLGAVTCFAGQMIQPALLGFGMAGALKGIAVGFALLLPLYLLRATGAGDVKLMAMVGAYLGSPQIWGALFGIALAGGLLAVAVALRRGVFLRMLQNIQSGFYGSLSQTLMGELPTMGLSTQPAAQLPYGVAIALGTLGYLAWQADSVGLI